MAEYHYLDGSSADGYISFHTIKSATFYAKGYINSDGKYYFYIYADVGGESYYGFTMTFRLEYTDENGTKRTVNASDNIDQPYYTKSDEDGKYKATFSGTLPYKPVTASLIWYCSDTTCNNNDTSLNSSGGHGEGYLLKNVKFTQYTKPTNFDSSITAVTGTTITAKATWTNGSDTATTKVECVDVDSNTVKATKTISSTGSSVTFTGLSRYTDYKIKFTLSDGTTTTSDALTATTYKATITNTSTTANTITFKVNGVGKLYTKDTTKKVFYTVKNSSGTVIRSNTTSVASGTTITIDATNSSTYTVKPEPNTEYTISIYLENCKNSSNVNDATATLKVTTQKAVSNATYTIDSTSGTTTTITPTFTLNGSKSGTITLYYKQTTASSFTRISNITKDEPYTIVDLDNGESYTIFIKVTDEAGNYSTSAYMSTVTYKVDTTLDDISTQAFKFTPTVTHGGNKNRVIEYKITGGDTGDGITGSCNSGDSVIVGKLKHGTMHTIEAWIKDMVDEHGDIDTQMAVMSTTKKFRVVCTSQTATLNTISTVVRAQMSVSEYLYEDYDKCHLTNDLVEFVLDECKNNPYKHDDEDGYTYNTPTDGADSLTGDYQKDYTILTTGEPWTYYYIVVCVTDGYNKAYVTAPCHTLFPYVKVFVDGEWKDAIPFIYTNGKWINAMPYKYNSNNWKL